MNQYPSARPRITRIALMAVAITVALQASSSANHSWGGYHWARTTNPVTVEVGDNVSSGWDAHLALAASDWDTEPSPAQYLDYLNPIVVAGRANPRNCRPTSGRVEVCNSSYGNNGWLGVAQVWVSGLHIVQGTVKLNDYYFNNYPPYNGANKEAWKQMVVCQEVGHTWGLDHQDENFNNQNLGTCMDYTSNVIGPPDNEHPNLHDYQELSIIYEHLDSTTPAKPSPAFNGAELDSPSQWGQLMKVAHGGKTQIFERDFGNGQKIVTFVIWA